MKLFLLLLIAGCGHGFTMERSHQDGCNEACTRAAAVHDVNLSSASVSAEDECACLFSDGSTELTCRRPMIGGDCS